MTNDTYSKSAGTSRMRLMRLPLGLVAPVNGPCLQTAVCTALLADLHDRKMTCQCFMVLCKEAFNFSLWSPQCAAELAHTGAPSQPLNPRRAYSSNTSAASWEPR